MKKIVMYGTSTRRKVFFLRELCSLLAINNQVVLVTNEYWWIDDTRQININESLDIYHSDSIIDKKIDDSEGYMIIDAQEIQNISYDKIFFMSSIYKEEVFLNEPLFRSIEKIDGILYQELLYDTNINADYLNNRYNIDVKNTNIHKYYLQESDLAWQIECDYNEKINIKYYSKAYKKSLIDIICNIDNTEKKVIKKWFKELKKRQKKKGVI